MGLETGFQGFAVETYARGSASARVSFDGRELPLECLGFIYSASCDGTVPIEVTDVGRAAEEDLKSIEGAIRGRAAYCRPGDEMRSRRYRSLIDRGAAACIFASHVSHHDACIISVARPTEKSRRVPAIGLNRTSTEIMNEAADAAHAMITIGVEGEIEASKSGNVHAVLHGRSSLPGLVLGAHLDSYDISEGALDNGAGVALVLQLAKTFAGMGAPLRSIRFVLFTGEETGCIGSARYVAENVGDPSGIGLYFNVDMPAEGGVPGIMFTQGASLGKYLKAESSDLGHRFPTLEMSGRSSDHTSFSEKGIPCLWLRAFNPGIRGPSAQEHTVLDTTDKVDMIELRESCMLAGRLILKIADSEILPFGRPSVKPDQEKLCSGCGL